ncbi:MAG: hypothetical protein RM021_020595 [Nostoc sp. EkiNYC01]|nr:hypothetical protein [Nostoc sp. EkiNYC01]
MNNKIKARLPFWISFCWIFADLLIASNGFCTILYEILFPSSNGNLSNTIESVLKDRVLHYLDVFKIFFNPQSYTKEGLIAIGAFLITALLITLIEKNFMFLPIIVYFWVPTLIANIILASILKPDKNHLLHTVLSCINITLFTAPFLYLTYLAMDLLERLLKIDKILERLLWRFFN